MGVMGGTGRGSHELASRVFGEGSAPMPSVGLSACSVGSVAVKGCARYCLHKWPRLDTDADLTSDAPFCTAPSTSTHHTSMATFALQAASNSAVTVTNPQDGAAIVFDERVAENIGKECRRGGLTLVLGPTPVAMREVHGGQVGSGRGALTHARQLAAGQAVITAPGRSSARSALLAHVLPRTLRTPLNQEIMLITIF